MDVNYNSTQSTFGFSPPPPSEYSTSNQGSTRSGHSVDRQGCMKLEISRNVGRFRKIGLGTRIILPFKTAANTFVRYGIGSALGITIASAFVGNIAGGAVTGLATLPLAGIVKLGEMLAGSKKGIAGKVLMAGSRIGSYLGAIAAGAVTSVPSALAGLGIGMAAGVGGFILGIRDTCKTDIYRLEAEHKTLNEFFDALKEFSQKAWKFAKKAFELPQSSYQPLDEESDVLDKESLTPGLTLDPPKVNVASATSSHNVSDED